MERVAVEAPLPRRYVAEEREATPELDEWLGDLICELCREDRDEDRLLICDGCYRGTHMDCLDPPLDEVPEGDWVCPACEGTSSYDMII